MGTSVRRAMNMFSCQGVAWKDKQLVDFQATGGGVVHQLERIGSALQRITSWPLEEPEKTSSNISGFATFSFFIPLKVIETIFPPIFSSGVI